MSYNLYQNLEYTSEARTLQIIKNERTNSELMNAKSAVHNPKTDWIHLELNGGLKLENFSEGDLDWSNFVKASNVKALRENRERYLSGSVHMNEDQAMYNHYSDEYVEIAKLAHDRIHALSAGVITSTDFPSITVTTVTQDIINKERLEILKYNLLNVMETMNTDQIRVRFPEYDDNQNTVKTGYAEGDPIDTIGIGAFTFRTFGLQKAGAKVAYTEEFFMRQYEYPVTSYLTQKIAADFVRVRHNRVLNKLADFTDITAGSIGSGDWATSPPAQIHSSFQPQRDLTAAKTAINTDKLARADTIISNESQWVDYDLNTWTNGFAQPLTSTNVESNNTIPRPKGIPWCREWILNEDIADDKAFILDRNAFLNINGPRRVAQGQTLDPVQTILVQKQWFEIHLKEPTWGRELTGI